MEGEREGERGDGQQVEAAGSLTVPLSAALYCTRNRDSMLKAEVVTDARNGGSASDCVVVRVCVYAG